MTESLKVPKLAQDEITAVIASPDSPVGIDAKQTHVIIIHKLLQIEARLATIESKLAGLKKPGD